MVINVHHRVCLVPAGFLLVALGIGHAAMLQAVKVESSSRLVNPARHYIARASGAKESDTYNYARSFEIDAAQGCSGPIPQWATAAISQASLRGATSSKGPVMSENDSSVPFELRAINARAVGELLGLTPRAVLETVACRPDFPIRVSMRPATWVAGEILKWRDTNRAGLRAGRRKT